ncbi:MAG TPA: polymer-forming cytoskeletal protein [Aggregatilinea sp.]|jgi:hypothetical protein|uniref:polymer-forming cytoskeletal protein n=1 Tax=Aggregatilinea sp. TaxID=2806333 RepID=UPI002CAD2AC0|nr:polymer-forming cytoskeletal protein [Aggregatilinea sp.]HML20855.1 polymer-forming cytoskeletal protein [Aggregatilinea sp.]
MTGRKRRVLIVGAAAVGAFILGVLLLIAVALGAPDLSGFSFHGTFTLNSSEQRSGDQVVFANNAYLRPDSVIDGNTTLIANHVEMEGRVDGDLVVIANELILADTAQVTGDLSVCVKTLDQSPDAQIMGTLKHECSEGERVTVSSALDSGRSGWRGTFLFRLGSFFSNTLFLGGLAALASAIFPQRIGRISATARRSPGLMGGVGCLTAVVAIGLTIVYALSLFLILPIILLPFAILGWLTLALLAGLGWFALASVTGEFVLHRLDMNEQPPLVIAAVGGIALGLFVNVWSLFWFTGWIGAIVSAVVGSVGLGAVMLTRIGSQPYPRAGES